MAERTRSLIPTGTWTVDAAHSTVGFAVKHMGIATVRGRFTEFEGTLEVGEDLAGSSARGTVKAASITTEEQQRDEHLRSPDFFDVAKFPTITFKSKKVKASGATKAKVTGDLTIHGVTKEVVLDAQLTPETQNPWGQTVRGATATTKINRKDFGLGWNKVLEAGGVLVGDEVKIQLDLELRKLK